METPPPEPPPRRTTRSALVEIPARLGALSVSENRHIGELFMFSFIKNILNVHNLQLIFENIVFYIVFKKKYRYSQV